LFAPQPVSAWEGAFARRRLLACAASTYRKRDPRITFVRPRIELGLVCAASAACLAASMPNNAMAAAACPAPADAPALATVDPEVRLQYLARAFDREIHDVDLWSWTWGSIYVAAGGGQLAASLLVRDRGTHIDLRVGAISAGIGALALYGLPLQVTLPLRDARHDWGEADRCRVLLEAEATLATVASRQRVGSGWAPHIGNVLFNVGLALVLGWGYRRWTSAAWSAGIGAVIGETNILTEPHRLPGVLDRYRSGHLDDPTDALDTPSWQMAFKGQGAGLAWEFRF
jgi:hypothetical protein